MKRINGSDTLYKITKDYPETIDVFVAEGFTQMESKSQRETFGKKLTLEMALKLRKIGLESFIEKLEDIVEQSRDGVDETLKEVEFDESADIKIQGILPCPVRIPLLESWTEWMNANGDDLGFSVTYDLKAASMGVGWLEDSLRSADDEEILSDLFLSAGFDLFFDEELMGKFKAKGTFSDMSGITNYNRDFHSANIELKDPKKEYAIIGVVPAVFLVNEAELGDIKRPESWEDLLRDEFEGRVSLPIGDFDLFNAILLNIYKNYGEEGVRKLGKSLLKSMHPSQMVKSHRESVKPLVTIMPYFFTKMVHEGGPMSAVWPSDGAIISPIFLLSKASKSDKLKPIVDFFASKDVGEILSHNGRFPSVHPEVDNLTAKDKAYMWLGWDYIEQNNIGALIKKCETYFNEGSSK